jgi:hypothetical protein
MNEQIKKLAVASQLVHEDQGRLLTGWLEHVDLTEYLAAFAESIVQECIEQIQAQHIPLTHQANAEEWDVGYNSNGVDSVRAIKTHFGVDQ